MQLRKADPSRELDGHYRHRARNDIERVYDSLSKQSPSGKSPRELMERSFRLERSIEQSKEDLNASHLSNKSRKIPAKTFATIPKLKKVYLETDSIKTHFKATQGFIHGATVKDTDHQVSSNLNDQNVQTRFEQMRQQEANRERKRYAQLEEKSLYFSNR